MNKSQHTKLTLEKKILPPLGVLTSKLYIPAIEIHCVYCTDIKLGKVKLLVVVTTR